MQLEAEFYRYEQICMDRRRDLHMSQQPGKAKQGLKRLKWKQWKINPIFLASIAFALLAILSGVGAWAVIQHSSGTGSTLGSTPQPGSASSATATGTPVAGPVSPMLFGTNLSLFDNNDQVLNSSGTLSQLQKLHTTIIRMPVRS